MARIVGAFGVPHTPIFPFIANRDGPGCDVARYFSALTAELEKMSPDLVLMFDTDHLNTFFLDNLPIFAIGVTDRFKAPNDEPRDVPIYDIKSHARIGAHILRHAVGADYDLALVQKFTADHSIAVPLHFMTPHMNIPVVPIFISGHIPPLPSARRCFDLGRVVQRAVEEFPEPLRVVVMGSGSFSLEVFGPRIAPGRNDGVPDPDWANRVCDLIERMEVSTLIEEATEEQLLKAGNVGGEILNWIAMLGTINRPKPPLFLQRQMENGHAYAVWN